jgi:hypothetical protein
VDISTETPLRKSYFDTVPGSVAHGIETGVCAGLEYIVAMALSREEMLVVARPCAERGSRKRGRFRDRLRHRRRCREGID